MPAILWLKSKILSSHFLMNLFLSCGLLAIADIYPPIANAAELNYTTTVHFADGRNLIKPRTHITSAHYDSRCIESSNMCERYSGGFLRNAVYAEKVIQAPDTNATHPPLLSIKANCSPGFIINNDLST